MKHDPCCRYGGTPSHGECDCTLIARVRADERTRELQASRETALTIASNVAALERHHVEAVAARLVEVICRMQDRLDDERAVGAALLTAQQMAVRGRDMARAEVAALREQIAAEQKVMLDRLLAKVEGLYVRCTEDPWRNEELTDWVRRDVVLALFKEAQHD